MAGRSASERRRRPWILVQVLATPDVAAERGSTCHSFYQFVLLDNNERITKNCWGVSPHMEHPEIEPQLAQAREAGDLSADEYDELLELVEEERAREAVRVERRERLALTDEERAALADLQHRVEEQLGVAEAADELRDLGDEIVDRLRCLDPDEAASRGEE